MNEKILSESHKNTLLLYFYTVLGRIDEYGLITLYGLFCRRNER